MSSTEKEVWLATLASGSSGNANLIGGSDGKHLLVDCGISCKRIIEGAGELSVSPENISAVFITHEHIDHVKGLMMLIKKYKIPVFASLGTLSAISQFKDFSNEYRRFMYKLEADRPFVFEGFRVNAFNLPHDAAEPTGFSFEKQGVKISVCTDFGMVTDEIENGLKNSNALVLEANHDEHMLEAGSYPYMLKRRILGNTGHISNENSGKLISRLWNRELRHIFLSHLSDENNMPELALETVRCELRINHGEYEKFTNIEVARRDVPSEKKYIRSDVQPDEAFSHLPINLACE